MNSITIHSHQIIHNGKRSDFWKLAEQGKWEPETFSILDRFIQKDKIFIDIGAWNGVCSLYAASLGAICYAIEPDPVAFKELSDNVSRNNLPINCSMIALSNRNATASLNSMTGDGFGNSESSLVARSKVGQQTMVTTRTLSTFIHDKGININNVCLIKMDIEGGELLVLQEAKEFLSRYPTPLYISFHPAWFPDLKEATKIFIDVLFKDFTAHNLKEDKRYSEIEFAKALLTDHEHSFLFFPKSKNESDLS